MGFAYGKVELIQDLQEVFAKHNVQSVEMGTPGVLFQVKDDGVLDIGADAIITAFDELPDDKKKQSFKAIDGGIHD